ncbi:hypothetical protein C8R44DRAFT_876761 [Mycena epipterygia]|nr:hypothetical protein C8R44DRAFT_876761 [Mycena epipterygia]
MSAAIRARINAAIAAILASNPAHWRRGVLYDFGIPVTQPPPLTTNRRARRAAARRPEIKIGRSNRPLRRQREWKQEVLAPTTGLVVLLGRPGCAEFRACPKLRRCHFPRAPPPRRRRPNFVKKGFSYSSETP